MTLSFNFKITLAIILIVLSGCSSATNHPFITDESNISRENSIIVIGINWKEVYNNKKDKLETLNSEDLLKREELINEYMDDPQKQKLFKPLHYLANFNFQFSDQNKNRHELRRFNKYLNQYETITLHEFSPGTIRLDQVTVDQYRYDKELNSRGDNDHWHRFWVKYPEDYGTWEIEKGKIIYLGNITFYFQTQKFIFGLFTKQELVDNIKLVRVEIQDQFEATKQQLRKSKSWFPVENMINKATHKQWIYHKELLMDKKTQKKKKKKTDKSKFFF